MAVFQAFPPVVPHFKAISQSIHEDKERLKVENYVESRQELATVSKDSEMNSPTRTRGHGQRTKFIPSSRLYENDTRSDRTVFIGNIPASCSKKHVRRLFKAYGQIQSIRLRSVRVASGNMPSKLAKVTHRQLVEGSTFNAYVIFTSVSDAKSSLVLNGTIFQGRHLRVDLVGKTTTLQDKHRSVFVGNLPFSADEEQLRTTFSDCGAIESVRIVRDSKTGIGKGFGFILFNDRCGVMFALKQNKKIKLDGRYLRVFKSKNEQTLQKEQQVKFGGIQSSRRNRTLPKSKSNPGKSAGKRADGSPVTRNKQAQKCCGVKGNKVKPTDSESQQSIIMRFTGKRRPDGRKNRYRYYSIEGRQNSEKV